MEAMQISIRHEYQADPQAVIDMMADEVWLAEVARRAGAEDWQVSAADGRSQVHARVAAPERAKRFTGPNLMIHLTISWDEPLTDGTHWGRIEVSLDGMPAKMRGTGEAAPAVVNGKPGTSVDYEAEFSINIPIVGRGLEQAAEPYVRRVIDTQQDVGRDYLAGRLR